MAPTSGDTVTKSIAVLGAGLLGRLIAWRLLQNHHHVSLFEAGDFSKPRSAANTAAAMISPYSEAVVANKTIYSIGMRSLELWPQWIAEINQQSSQQVAIVYANPGTLVVAHSQDHAELQQFKQDLVSVLGTDDNSHWLDRASLQNYEADLSHFNQALYLPDEAFLDNRALLNNLLSIIQNLGGNCIDSTPIAHANQTANRYRPEDFELIIDCRGLGAKQDWPNLRGVRGEVMWVQCRELQFRHAIRLMHPRYKLYVVPKPNHHYIIGATEIESEDLSPISLQSNLELASALYSIHPAFAEARIVETDVNLRPAFLDNEPRIQFEDNVIRINGLYRHGFLLAPTMVDDTINWINGDKLSPYWSYYA